MKEIGGYFELELLFGEEYHKNAIRLNSGRNAFEYILRAKAYRKVFLPYYTCNVMLEPVRKLNLTFEFYNIDENLYPLFDFDKIASRDVFVYNNYFGVCDKQIELVSTKVKNLIIDNSQAFYALPLHEVDAFYSPRKFFGLPDGAYLYTDTFLNETYEQDMSWQRFEHLIGRIDLGAESFYKIFRQNDESLINQPIKKMSKLTHKLLSSIDYKLIAKKRKNNFNILHQSLQKTNELMIRPLSNTVPMVYPYLIKNGAELKRKLIANKIYIASYWANVQDWTEANSFEYNLVENLLALPVDQRYDVEEMKKIIDIISNYV